MFPPRVSFTSETFHLRESHFHGPAEASRESANVMLDWWQSRKEKKEERDVIYGVVLLWTRLANTVLDTAE